MNNFVQRHERAILLASLAFLAFSMVVSGRTWLLRSTAPAPRSHAVLRLSLPGLDLGADAIPAGPGRLHRAVGLPPRRQRCPAAAAPLRRTGAAATAAPTSPARPLDLKRPACWGRVTERV